MFRPHPDAEVLRHAHAQLAHAGEVRQPVDLALGGVRSVVVDSGEHRVDERAVLREVVVRPGHELPADVDAVGREVLGPDLRSEEDEVLGGG